MEHRNVFIVERVAELAAIVVLVQRDHQHWHV